MAAVHLPEIVDALTVAWRAAATLDGVRVTKTWEILPEGEREHVFVAGDGSVLGGEDIATYTIDWPGLSPTSCVQEGVIDCAASVWTGDEKAVDATIARTFAIVDACFDVLRADPSLGLAYACQVKPSEGRLRVLQDGSGLLVAATFDVGYQTSE